MKIDLVGPARRGLAMGLNEAAGYGAVAVTALATGYIAAALRAAPRAVLPRHRLRRARPRPVHPVRPRDPRPRPPRGRHPRPAPTAATTTCTPSSPTGRCSPRPASASRRCPRPARPGMVNNLNDGLAWGLFPLLFAAAGLSVGQIGVLAALYPAVWGLGQLVTGALSDRIGRKPLIVGGMLLQAVALGLVAATTRLRAVGARPRSCSAPAPRWSTRPCSPPSATSPTPPGGPASVGVYRLWRDGGFAVGALLAGVARRRLRHRRRHLGRRRPHRRLRARRRGRACTKPTRGARRDSRDPSPLQPATAVERGERRRRRRRRRRLHDPRASRRTRRLLDMQPEDRLPELDRSTGWPAPHPAKISGPTQMLTDRPATAEPPPSGACGGPTARENQGCARQASEL